MPKHKKTNAKVQTNNVPKTILNAPQYLAYVEAITNRLKEYNTTCPKPLTAKDDNIYIDAFTAGWAEAFAWTSNYIQTRLQKDLRDISLS